jgi:hypothetical protein
MGCIRWDSFVMDACGWRAIGVKEDLTRCLPAGGVGRRQSNTGNEPAWQEQRRMNLVEWAAVAVLAGSVSLALSGKGEGWNLGVAFGAFIIE